MPVPTKVTMRIRVELSEAELQVLVKKHLEEKLGDVKLDFSAVRIEVKSKQNYKSEWEIAAYRAVYEVTE